MAFIISGDIHGTLDIGKIVSISMNMKMNIRQMTILSSVVMSEPAGFLLQTRTRLAGFCKTFP